MAIDLTPRLQAALPADGRALTSSELAARLRQPPAAVEAALDALRDDPALVVCEFPVADPHFGLDRVLVAARLSTPDDAARQAATARCRHVYDELLRDFLASHRCV